MVSETRHSFGTQSLYAVSHIHFVYCLVSSLVVPHSYLTSPLAFENVLIQHWQPYRNPPCACVARVNNCYDVLGMLLEETWKLQSRLLSQVLGVPTLGGGFSNSTIHLFYLGNTWYVALVIRLLFYAITFVAAIIAGMRYVCATSSVMCWKCW